MDGFRIGVLIVLAVLVGAAIPVLLELRRTLRALREAVERLGPRVDETLAKVNVAADSLGRVGEDLQRATGEVRAAADQLGSFSGYVKPALAGLLSSFLGRFWSRPAPERPREEVPTP